MIEIKSYYKNTFFNKKAGDFLKEQIDLPSVSDPNN